MTLNRMRQLQIALRNHGVRMTFANHGELKKQVTSAYLDMKGRQAL
jgi:hypothetical protein